jgi:hypothetical protein
MSKSTLRFLAVLLAVLMVGVIFAGLDNLPRDLRAQIAAERGALAGAQTQLKTARDQVSHDLESEATLFRAIPSAQQYPGRLARATGTLQSAARDMDELATLERRNRRSDRRQAETLLSRERRMRSAAVADAESVRKDAAHWVELKHRLPQEVQDMERDYKAIHVVDLAALATAVEKAEADWPEKKPDLESRLATVRNTVTRSDELWTASTEARKAAAENDVAKVDFGALFAAADVLKTGAASLPKQSGELRGLSAQLYDSWDKILVDMEVRGSGSAREYNQKIRTVRTHLATPGTPGTPGTPASDEKWVDVSPATYQAMEKNLGMAIEHKPAGKYDTEAERVAQPAGFAYIAPPGQSNQYGHWDHHDGRDFWVFYGQYALMRDLLFNRDYRPLDRYEYEDYRSSRNRNQTYYGRDATAQAPKYGTQGTATQERYSGSSYGKSGGFKDSQYASKPGGYRDSQYASPSARDPNSDHSPRKFGAGASRPEQPRAAPPPPSQRSYRPAPTPYRPAPSRSPGRTFGGSRRR